METNAPTAVERAITLAVKVFIRELDAILDEKIASAISSALDNGNIVTNENFDNRLVAALDGSVDVADSLKEFVRGELDDEFDALAGDVALEVDRKIDDAIDNIDLEEVVDEYLKGSSFTIQIRR